MALTKTQTLERCDVHASSGGYKMWVYLITVLDDPDDSDLPIESTSRIEVTEGSDISSLPQLVKDIYSVVWP